MQTAHHEVLHIESMQQPGVCGLRCRGHSFFSTNEELLDRYAECPGSAEVIAVQTSYLDALHAAPRAVPGVLHRVLSSHCMPAQRLSVANRIAVLIRSCLQHLHRICNWDQLAIAQCDWHWLTLIFLCWYVCGTRGILSQSFQDLGRCIR